MLVATQAEMVGSRQGSREGSLSPSPGHLRVQGLHQQ